MNARSIINTKLVSILSEKKASSKVYANINRDCEGGCKDSAWCTTYKAPDHFHNYYYKQGITFYYIRVKNESIIDALKTAFPSKQGAMVVVALLVNKSGKLSDGYDGTDAQLSAKEIATFRQIVGI